jgi:hypothetical protein
LVPIWVLANMGYTTTSSHTLSFTFGIPTAAGWCIVMSDCLLAQAPLESVGLKSAVGPFATCLQRVCNDVGDNVVSEHRTGGQRQVQGDGVLQSNGVQRQRLLRGARRRPAMSTRGVRQGDCQWRDAPLHRARWREALPAQGLLQGIASRDTAALRRARRREAVPPGGLLEARSRRRRAVLLRARRRQAVST